MRRYWFEFAVLTAVLFGLSQSAFSQSPNTATLVVTIADQTGGVVNGAKVTVLNSATGATRDVAEFGWTAGPALNIVTKSGTNNVRGEALYMSRPGDLQAKTFSIKGYCAPAVASCVTPTTLTAINPADVPDVLNQLSGTIGAPLVKDKTFFFVTADSTMQDRTTFLSTALPAFLLPADGHLDYEGNYRQTLVNARVDHKFTPTQTLMVRANIDRFYDTNPNDAVAGTSAPSVARRYSRRSVTGVTSPALPSLARSRSSTRRRRLSIS